MHLGSSSSMNHKPQLEIWAPISSRSLTSLLLQSWNHDADLLLIKPDATKANIGLICKPTTKFVIRLFPPAKVASATHDGDDASSFYLLQRRSTLLQIGANKYCRTALET